LKKNDKLIKITKFNNLINILTLSLAYGVGSNSLLISDVQHIKYLMKWEVNCGVKVRIQDICPGFDTMLNHKLS